LAIFLHFRHFISLFITPLPINIVYATSLPLAPRYRLPADIIAIIASAFRHYFPTHFLHWFALMAVSGRFSLLAINY
jgi:hypothetical protein